MTFSTHYSFTLEIGKPYLEFIEYQLYSYTHTRLIVNTVHTTSKEIQRAGEEQRRGLEEEREKTEDERGIGWERERRKEGSRVAQC